MIELLTDRLYLRTINEDDIEDIYEYSKEENVGPNAGWRPHSNIEETKQIAKDIFIDKEDIFGIILKSDNKLIGTIGFMDDPKRENNQGRMIGYAMGEKHWGKGIMSEAVKEVVRYGFEGLNYQYISAYCYPTNKGSRRLLEKSHFDYEGCLRKAEISYDGELLDNLCYILERDKYINGI